MRKLILIGLALTLTMFVVPRSAEALGGQAAWCRIARDTAGRDCSFYTFEQCAASTERLNGGGCYQNPHAQDNATPAADRTVPKRKPARSNQYDR